MTAECVDLVVRGVVQGVFFRASTRDVARSLGLRGTVQNLPDGSVRAVAEGPRPALEALIEWCRTGPAGARVTDLAVRWLAATGGFEGFSILR